MTDFQISFERAWFLLALIPALALTSYTYFRLAKKFRRTRNRVISVTLHILITIMATCLLAGLTFKYNVKNDGNNVLFVVDMSDTIADVGKTRDEFVEDTIRDCNENGYKVGVVTFGYNQIYAAPISGNASEVIDQFVNAPKPDTTATDIAGALTYAKNIVIDGFDPATSKIVLVTDGRETEGNAVSVIRSIVSTGIKVNTVYVDREYKVENNQIVEDSEIQVVDIILPERHIDINEDFEVKVAFKAKQPMNATVEFYDNGEKVYTQENVNFAAGDQEVKVPLKYEMQGLHELECKVIVTKENGDRVVNNNKFCTYHMVESYNKVLILESENGKSKNLEELLSADDQFNVTVVGINDLENLPKTVDELRQYDQVIMNNIANSDLPLATKDNGLANDYIDILYSYVSDFGGNMLTVGGLNEAGDKPHAYNKADMAATKYQEMLPVQVVDYKPPIATYIIVDVSGSMTGVLDDAIEGARSIARNALDEKDYIAIEVLGDTYKTLLPLTSAIHRSEIEAAIDKIKETDAGASTNYAPAIERAGKALTAMTNVEKKHIVIVSDGMPGDPDEYPSKVKHYNENFGITLTVVVVGGTSTSSQQVAEAIKGYGECVSAEAQDLTRIMRENVGQLKVPQLEEDPEGFNPKISAANSPIFKDIELAPPATGEGEGEAEPTGQVNQFPVKIYGYFGVKPRNHEDMILSSKYGVPLYSQWRFGKGSVGSFMCDLDGTWSRDLLADEKGKKLITNIAKNLMPIENIRPLEMNVSLSEDNYTNRLSITTNFEIGETIKAEIQKVGSDEVISLNEMVSSDISPEELSALKCYVTSNLSEDSAYSKATFVVKDSGTYKLTILKVDQGGSEIARVELFKTFSYSAEYDEFLYNVADLKDNLSTLAARGGGSLVEDNSNPVEIMEGFISKLPREFDPRYIFATLAILMFLLDIIVRKFKFKWPHEIIRDRKAAREDANL